MRKSRGVLLGRGYALDVTSMVARLPRYAWLYACSSWVRRRIDPLLERRASIKGLAGV
jgi:hypothetical protein